MKRTPLHDAHVELGARLVEFSGWEMPLQYPTGINEEHLAVRHGVGLFDVSHMGEVVVSGPGAVEFLRYVALNDAAKLRVGRAHYSMLANDRGGLIDDVYLYRIGDEEYLLVCNAGSREDVVSHLRRLATGYDCTVIDRSDEWALLALQGPGSAVLLERLAKTDLTELRKNGLRELELFGATVRIARTGYTGEDGFEIFVPAASAEEVWRGLVRAGATPCGLGARDTLRLEAGYALFGSDLSATTNPLCTPFKWVVKDKEFFGREKIWGASCPRVLVGLKLNQRGVARHGYRLFQGQQQIGEISSGTISPVTREGIAMGWIDRRFATPGQAVSVEIRGQKVPATIVEMPFIEG
ncbi:MAG TPA: glycine cleavage system aminomethyltransferase GcvT [Trueperaceae bacterium]